MMRLKQTGWMLLGVLLLAPVTLAQQATQTRPQLTLEDIHASRTFIPEFFQGGRWAEEGPVILYIEPDPQTGATHLIRYNLETGRRERLIDGNRLYAHDVGRLIRIENYQYSRDGRRVLLYTDSERVWRYNTKGFYYVYDLEADSLRPDQRSQQRLSDVRQAQSGRPPGGLRARS